MVGLFLEKSDVNPDLPDMYGQTPLSYASRSGHGGVVKLLLERGGVNPNLSDKCGQTPLSYASGIWIWT